MRIGILSDNPAESELLQRAIGLRPEHRVLWVARATAEATRLCTSDPPALVLLDIVSGTLDPVAATRDIKAATSCAILIVTGSVRANAARVYEAMGQGALDAVDAPLLDGRLEETAAPLLAKLLTISRLIGDRGAPPRVGNAAPRHAQQRTLVAIGASAGGPGALAAILSQLPSDFPAAIVVVQHVDHQFARGMAQWLGRQSALPVQIAKDGDHATDGVVLLAGTSEHLVLKGGDRVAYTPEPRNLDHCPSIDVFFQSVCAAWKGTVVGVLLTGMGRDGAGGLKSLRDKGFHTIAQDEATSVVYGMPKAAARLNAAVDILPMDQISHRLLQLVVGDELQVEPAHATLPRI